MNVSIDLRVENKGWDRIPDLETLCQNAVAQAVKYAGVLGAVEVDILLSDNEELAELNHNWRDKAGPTDVLSFPADAREKPFIGDIAVAFGVAHLDADTSGTPFRAHLTHLIVHGVLHLLGYDHQNDEDAHDMETLERDVMEALGYADPYSRIEQS
ncbi:MAG: rRNA maturation RNase YbeY [Pseudomonadota bacterium]